MNVAWLLLLAALIAGCESKSRRPAPGLSASASPAPSAAASSAAASISAVPAIVVDEHGDEDAHPPREPPQVSTATALSAESRGKLTTLRVMAHEGAVIIRKEQGGWVISGPNGCRVPPARIERALDNLAALQSERATERPRSSRAFELQVVVQIDQERALHFDMAGRVAGRDLVQLGDYSTYWISGFDRELWAPNARVWCAGP